MTDADLETIAEAMAEVTLGGRKNHDKIVEGFALLLNTVVRLDVRVAELEQRPELKHVGVWREGKQYRAANLVTKSGSMWICRSDTTAMRGADAAWQLVVKGQVNANGHDTHKRIATGVRR